MQYACIKNGIVENVIEAEQGFIDSYLPESGMDTIIPIQPGFGMGDIYNGKFAKSTLNSEPVILTEPADEEKAAMAEAIIEYESRISELERRLGL